MRCVSAVIDSMNALPVRARATMVFASSPSGGRRIDFCNDSFSTASSGRARNHVPAYRLSAGVPTGWNVATISI